MQQAGPPNIRRHALRHLVRITVLGLGDVAALAVLGWVAYLIRHEALLGAGASQGLAGIMPSRLDVDLDSGAALLLGLLVTGNYGQGDRRRSLRLLFSGTGLGMALIVWPSLWYGNTELVLVGAAAWVMAIWGALVVERFAIEHLVNVVGWSAADRSRTVFVGRSEEYRTVIAGPAYRSYSARQNLGFVDVGAQPAPGALGVLADLGSILLERGAECVVVCGHLEDQEFRGIVESARDAGCHLFSVPRAFRIVGVEPKLVWRHGQPLIELTSPAVKGQELVVKRLLDFLLSLAGLVLLAPVFLLVATAIKLDSPGPVFYRPWRRGRFWQPYRMWKFRSMVVDADERLEQDPTMRAEYAINIKLVRDPRVTRVGRLIRKWSVDELPQLFNVLIGEMSLVGPRPKALGEEARYGAAADTVLAVRPGITGLWQISGRCATTYDERIALEVRYASRPSLWGDLEILLRTVPVVLKGTGAH